MKIYILTMMICMLSVFMLLPFTASTADAAGKRVIVIFDESTPQFKRRDIVLTGGGSIVRELSIVPAIVINLPEQASDRARDAILQHAPVVRIEDDVVVNANPKPDKPGGEKRPSETPPSEVIPWGIQRIDADIIWGLSTGLGVKVAVLDTGIDINHPDLVYNIAGGINIINTGKSYDDDNGHGTHVAGTIAATDNEIGVIGAAPNASLYGVKVLDRRGSGWLSDVIAGLEWSIANGMDVINMSLSSAGSSQSMHDAVIAVYNSGIVQVAAAGNDGGPVGYPAAYAETIAAAATDSGDNVTSWSNHGSSVNVAAPGASIYSTYKGGGYKTLSGTSMASPHVAGVAALIIENQPNFTPAQVLGVITSTSDSLGLSSEFQGAGIVDAEEAVLITE